MPDTSPFSAHGATHGLIISGEAHSDGRVDPLHGYPSPAIQAHTGLIPAVRVR